MIPSSLSHREPRELEAEGGKPAAEFVAPSSVEEGAAANAPAEAPLTVAISSRAVFELDAEDQIWQRDGTAAYRAYQRAHEREPLAPGPAFAFVKRLLALNDIRPEAPLVDVILLSRNDPDTGLRAFNSTEYHGLPISRAAFLSGSSPFRYLDAFHAALFLSMNEADVNAAIEAGHPAGRVLPTTVADDPADKELRIAFDFDGVLADDEAEKIFAERQLEAFTAYERAHAGSPHNAGPLKRFIDEIARIQAIESGRRAGEPGYRARLRTAIITARGAPAHERVVATLRDWGIRVDETFFLGGLPKRPILEAFKPHIFFDDQRRNLEASSAVVPCAHIPFGVRNHPR